MDKTSLDKDLGRFDNLERAAQGRARRFAVPGLTLLFLLATVFLANIVLSDDLPLRYFVIAAGVIAGYMALNIGANDIANNMGPAVGGKALSLTAAIILAIIFEAAGALLAGGDVVNTIASGIIVPPADEQTTDVVTTMMAALLAAAMWIHLATYLRAPVSTTHSIVGGVLGSGVAAFGFQVIQWDNMSLIAASWIISPLMGGGIAAFLLLSIKMTILFREDRIAAARKWVPYFTALMLGVFAAYMAMKGLRRVWIPETGLVIVIALSVFALGWIGTIPVIRRQSANLDNKNKQVGQLFHIPLIMAAALMSFAHGANDVANAVGPLAAIVAATTDSITADRVDVPSWVLLIGAVGIIAGLALFGPRLINTVGEKITRMNVVRAYCVILSVGITVLLASSLGVPVSSTHIAIGGIFGVGLLREFLTNRNINRNSFLGRPQKKRRNIKLNDTPEAALEQEDLQMKRRLVRRRHMLNMIAAWFITVPTAAVMSAVLYFILNALV